MNNYRPIPLANVNMLQRCGLHFTITLHE